MTQIHIPVLLTEVLTNLQPRSGEHYLDLTAGYGGHAAHVAAQIGQDGQMVLVDRDQNAVEHVTRMFAGDNRAQILHSDYLQASRKLHAEGRQFDMILADIGLSSPHIDNANRGFSFQQDGPLDMRMDPRQQLTAAEIVNTWSREDIVTILQKYGELRGAGKAADAIIAARPLQTTGQLTGIVNRNRSNPKYRPEAQVFQALRIAVNDELVQLRESLPLWQGLLKPGGRLAVITFHSLEDRIVKQYFLEHGGNRYDADFDILTKQPVTCTAEESEINPRARSAKLRVAQRK